MMSSKIEYHIYDYTLYNVKKVRSFLYRKIKGKTKTDIDEETNDTCIYTLCDNITIRLLLTFLYKAKHRHVSLIAHP